MPYSRVSELPPSVKKGMSAKAQRIFMAVFNRAKANGDDETTAFRKAYAAVKNAGLNTSKASSDLIACECERAFLLEAAYESHRTTVHGDDARKFNAKERKKAASSGAALPDGSYPIKNAQDLRNAIQAFGRASNKARVKAHIKKRAAALGLTNLLPDSWKG